MFSAREQDFPVEPGSVKFGMGGEMQDYSQIRPINMEPGEIPDSLRRSAVGPDSVRPLLQGNSDGSPMSLADMEGRQRTMDLLDEMFTLRPSQKAAELMALEAETAKQERLKQDPFAPEHERFNMDMARRSFEMERAAEIGRETEAGRRDAFANDLRQLESDAQAEIDAALAEGDTDGAEKIGLMLEEQRELLQKKHEFGTRFRGSPGT